MLGILLGLGIRLESPANSYDEGPSVYDCMAKRLELRFGVRVRVRVRVTVSVGLRLGLRACLWSKRVWLR